MKKLRKSKKAEEEVLVAPETPVEEETKEEPEKEKIPYYIIDRVINPNDEESPLSLPHGVVFFMDGRAQARLDDLELRLRRLEEAAFGALGVTAIQEKGEVEKPVEE